MASFEFGNPKVFSSSKKNGLYLHLPSNINGKAELFRDYAEGLCAPGNYFGKNWDSFNDCLMDLQWIKEADIHIVHSSIPNLSDRDIGVYFNILSEAIDAWDSPKTTNLSKTYPEFLAHKIFVYFPDHTQNAVLELVS